MLIRDKELWLYCAACPNLLVEPENWTAGFSTSERRRRLGAARLVVVVNGAGPPHELFCQSEIWANGAPMGLLLASGYAPRELLLHVQPRRQTLELAREGLESADRIRRDCW